MDEILLGTNATIISGVFKDLQGIVVGLESNGDVVVEIEVFGRKATVTLERDELDIEDEDPRLCFRQLIEKDIADVTEELFDNWWIEKLKYPQDNLVAEWKAFEEFRASVEKEMAVKKQALLKEFEADFADIEKYGIQWAKKRWQGDVDYWIPYTHRQELRRTALLKLAKRSEAKFYAICDKKNQPIRQATARSWQAEVDAWRYDNLPDRQTLEARRQQARQQAIALVSPMRSGILSTCGN